MERKAALLLLLQGPLEDAGRIHVVMAGRGKRDGDTGCLQLSEGGGASPDIVLGQMNHKTFHLAGGSLDTKRGKRILRDLAHGGAVEDGVSDNELPPLGGYHTE